MDIKVNSFEEYAVEFLKAVRDYRETKIILKNGFSILLDTATAFGKTRVIFFSLYNQLNEKILDKDRVINELCDLKVLIFDTYFKLEYVEELTNMTLERKIDFTKLFKGGG